MTYDTINDAKTMQGGARGALLAGRYRIVRQLGQGGMGSVWLVEDAQLDNKPFAIKMLPAILVSNKRAYRQLKDEALVAMRLIHPNIVQIRAFEENDGNPFLVMDYVDGQTLDDYLAEKGMLTEEETIRVLRPIAAALDYAHGEGVVHRDVKPANVMIRKDGHPFILDFGIAREIQETLTRVTGKLSSGTLLYMSPEQLNGEPPRPAQDVYSFAAMAYECLNGEPPFVRGAIEDQIKNKQPEPPPGGTQLIASVMSGLAKKPEDRPPTCSAVLEGNGLSRVEHVERVETVGARVPRARTGGSRSRATALLAAAALVIAFVGGWWCYRHAQARERSRLVAEAREKAEREAAERMRQEAAQAQAEKEARERADAEARERAQKEARERERRAKWHKEGEEFTINDPYGLYMTMKWCPAGSFTMGSPASEDGRDTDETQHQVTLTKGFWLGQTEVTQGQWKKIMGGETVVDLARKALQDDTLYNLGGKQQTLREYWKMDRDGDPNNRCGDLNDNVPVYNVNWHEAVAFCQRLTQRERAEGRIPDGYEYRLPTEAEWEYACRARTTESLPNGRDARILGNTNAPALDDIAWYGGNSSVGFQGRGVDTSNWLEKQYPGGRAFAREVKGKQPNNWGLYDMIGNVWEWCGDWYGDYEYGSQTDPVGSASGAVRVCRGGGWGIIARYCRPATRARGSPGFRNYDLGFRVALAPVLPEEYRRAIQEELQKANVVIRHEQYPTLEVKREIQPEKETVMSKRSERGVHDKVQLWEGGPYWATTNIGAEKPWEYGYYFWWGDTLGYKREGDFWVASDGSSSNFSFIDKNTQTDDKTTAMLQSEGWITAKGVLTPEHDAAHVHWGGEWRMPTARELSDLSNKCDWKWTTANGVNGYVVRGRGDYASASIFLPSAGYGYGPSLYEAVSHGYYSSSVPYSNRIDGNFALRLYFTSSYHSTLNGDRDRGQSVRPVQGLTK